jgi:hypothetical protein
MLLYTGTGIPTWLAVYVFLLYPEPYRIFRMRVWIRIQEPIEYGFGTKIVLKHNKKLSFVKRYTIPAPYEVYLFDSRIFGIGTGTGLASQCPCLEIICMLQDFMERRQKSLPWKLIGMLCMSDQINDTAPLHSVMFPQLQPPGSVWRIGAKLSVFVLRQYLCSCLR